MSESSDAPISGQLRDIRAFLANELNTCDTALRRIGETTKAGAALGRGYPAAHAAVVLAASCRGAARRAADVAGRLHNAAGALDVIGAVTTAPRLKPSNLQQLLSESTGDAAISVITGTEAVAVVVAAGANHACQVLAEALGWDGKTPVFRLSRRKLAKYALQLRQQGQATRASWLTEAAPHRVLLLGPTEVQCLERSPQGWHVAKGTERGH